MVDVRKDEGYTAEQIGNAKRLIDVLMEIPEEKESIFTAVATAYIDGVETGARIAKEIKGKRRW